MYDRERDCPEGKCVVGAIEKPTGILQFSTSDEHRLQVLKYLVHLVGDVYQPLHAGYQDEKGGNKYQLQAFGHGSNLHALWDTAFIKNLQEDTDSLSQRLLPNKQPSTFNFWSSAKAAEASCRLVATDGFYPDRRVDKDYIQTYTPVVESQLSMAGTGLAAFLNRILR